MHPSSPLEDLGLRIWDWRARHQPRTRDDIPRLDRPDGWRPDFSAATVAALRTQRNAFAAELAALDPGPQPADVIDHRLLSSLLDRVTWELDVVRAWQCQPRFYIDQALGTVFDTLLRPGVDAPRVLGVIRLLLAAPGILADGLDNLAEHSVAEFATLAIDELADIDRRCSALSVALGAAAPSLADEVRQAGAVAAEALLDFRGALIAGLPTMARWTPVGSEQYQWFLRRVAVMPFTPSELLAVGTAELDRAIALEQIERGRRYGRPRPPAVLPRDTATQVRRQGELEQQVRDFYVGHGLLTQPESLRHYLIAEMPDYLEPLRFLGVADDLTSPARLQENAISYTPPPGADLPYFYAANAIDPRAGIVHEGAHYQQLALSWRHERPLRRHFYDSGPNEGIAFYNEEMMLAAGLFDDAPDTREIIYNFMRLRALRVKVDVGLATGQLGIDSAAEYLASEVPMDMGTAREEAAAFAEGPGQAISYQIGKSQIFALIADAVRLGGRDTALQPIHDFLWLNGNVPIALSRWELLGLTDELAAVDVAAPPTA
ncbi:Uncharacterized conserved protein, DUF885 familyt [Nakamurella panacisegetis]|uniref:Uncharacterized conserved protein, DUF885 familyt n=1 Tax=Nakamurella panacisegetis TaxID=1090615 RepID=A0A1H0MVE9_9ACTN|nr:DUF885 family protein [Nakamurella panacisegetis]SDO84438.1 Uncharacterized conserved protein, DUF885 familyt [Nakamurella panacisegetis]